MPADPGGVDIRHGAGRRSAGTVVIHRAPQRRRVAGLDTDSVVALPGDVADRTTGRS